MLTLGSARAFVLACTAVVLLSVCAVTIATAHSEYERSVPEAGARVPRVPERVEVWFTQELFRRGGANTIEVYASDGNRIDDNDPLIDTADRRHLSVGVARVAEPGEYRVEWRSLSAVDGDTANGSFGFTLDPAGPEPTTLTARPAEPSANPAPALTSGGQWVWWSLVALPSLLASGVVVVRALRAPFEGSRR